LATASVCLNFLPTSMGCFDDRRGGNPSDHVFSARPPCLCDSAVIKTLQMAEVLPTFEFRRLGRRRSSPEGGTLAGGQRVPLRRLATTATTRCDAEVH